MQFRIKERKKRREKQSKEKKNFIVKKTIYTTKIDLVGACRFRQKKMVVGEFPILAVLRIYSPK